MHTIVDDEATYKLCRVEKVANGLTGAPFAIAHDGRTIRHPDPLIKANDTLKANLDTNKIDEFYKFEVGHRVMASSANIGRVARSCTASVIPVPSRSFR